MIWPSHAIITAVWLLSYGFASPARAHDVCEVKEHKESTDVIAIENLQGRYLFAMNSNRLDFVPGLFAQNDPDITVDLPDNQGGLPLKGLANVTAAYSKLQQMVTAEGGFMGTHLATTPVVKVSEGVTAQGTWMSFGFTVEGPAFNHTDPPYPTLPVVGRYAHDFVKEDGVWKFKHFKWSIFVSLPPFDFNPATAGPGWANTPMVPGSKSTSWPLDPFDV
ncbi:hypothetical protein N7509_012698 [Penicillium cosmopolitanum]|uniref:SnoaL-like domain-containing protein n=1 Tax=Penicillium cosmopolitanum TaxID=1131564 RepID=A0A9W9SLR6_9EURO|nr:uncharacterized protein N7509_012698 [Penicillium cosmopolitanum]KAJ5379579.1 hypothetical protein N7509_012698 [Penicillium cosmopolitanum]